MHHTKLTRAGIFCVLIVLSFQHIFSTPLQPGDFVFADAQLHAIVRFRPSTGETNYLAPISFLGSDGGIALDSAGNIFATVSKGGFGPMAEFYRLDERSSQLVLLAKDPLIQSASRIIVSSDDKSLLIAGEGQDNKYKLFRLDLATATVSVLTTNFHSTFMNLVPADEHPAFLSRAPNGHLMIADNAYGHVVEFTEDGLNRNFLAEMTYPMLLTGVTVDRAGRIFVSGLNLPDKILNLDQTTHLTTPVGDHSLVRAPFDVMAASDGSLIVADPTADALIRVNPDTGEESIFLAGVPSPRTLWEYTGPALQRPVLSARRSANGITISWNDPVAAWKLESTSGLQLASPWNAVAISLNQTGDLWEAELPVDSVEAYYRLTQN
jgi:hypothetical protein